MPKVVIVFAVAVTKLYGQEETPDHRLRTSTDVLHEIMSAPDKGIPKDLLSKAQCVVIVPGLKKAAFVFGGDYGRGFAICRNQGSWGGPAAVRFSGGSFGAQIGGESTDVVMLIMKRRGMERWKDLRPTNSRSVGMCPLLLDQLEEQPQPRRISSYTPRFCPIRGHAVRL
jgi:lipid-binding SYLF domain-containing protein